MIASVNRLENNILRFAIILGIALTSSCIHPRIFIQKNIQSENQESKPLAKPSYSIFLAGDAGESKSFPLDPCLAAIKADAEACGTHGAVIWLGDNIYPAGLPEENAKNREDAEQALKAQLETVRNFQGKTIFIPGTTSLASSP